MKKALQQCRVLIEVDSELIDFKSFDERTLLEGLSLSSLDNQATSAEEMGVIIIDAIQTRLPNAKEILELLWYRNLLLEGLVAHFNFLISQNPALADLVDRMDRQRIQKELKDIKDSISQALKNNKLAEVGHLGTRATQLATTDAVYELQQNYNSVFAPLFEKVEELHEDHEEIKDKLDSILSMLDELQTFQRYHSCDSQICPELLLERPNVKELRLVEDINSKVKDVGWNSVPALKRTLTANSLAVGFYSSQKTYQSLAVLEDALEHNVENAQVYFNYFHVLQALQRYKEAVVAYNKAIEIDPKIALFPPDRYQLLDIIGHGGMGIVYKARSLEENIPVAVKLLLLPEEWYPGARERFLQAAKAATQLQHPNIVLIHDLVSEQSNYPCIIMEYLEGMNLQDRIEKYGACDLGEGFEIAHCIGEGLSYAHKQGIIHRDLKPGNVVIHRGQAKIIDFGLAKWERDSTLTLSGENYYTLYYSAPEQRINFHEVDQRSDVYSFGKTLYYIFTGEEPYDIDWDEVPKSIRKILHRATRKNRDNRYDTVEEMLKDLEKAVKGELKNGNGGEVLLVDSDVYPAIDVETKNTTVVQDIIDTYHLEGIVEKDGFFVSGKDGTQMVYVPAGTFLMGDESDRADYDEAPIHEVYLDGYLIDVFPVTNERYAKFLEALEKYNAHPSPWCHPDEPHNQIHIPKFWYNSKWNKPDYPVTGIDWWDAYAYCKWAGKSLTTEAQWEKAARGTDGRAYPWGHDLPTPAKCNFNKIYGQITPVDKFPNDRSPYGCSNMAGNIWEWCLDWFDPTYYRVSPSKNPTGPKFGRSPVGRGGCWTNDARHVRTTTRAYGNGRGDRNNHLGFRGVLRILGPKVDFNS